MLSVFERINPNEVTFSQKAGKGFYRQVEEATAKGEIIAFTTFSAMPSDWLPPAIELPFSASRDPEPITSEKRAIAH